MKYKHADNLMTMGRDHAQAELEVFKRHHGTVYDALFEVMTANHNCHKKALQEIHDRDVVELKKAMDPQIREHMKQLAKKHKDKQELSRYDLCVCERESVCMCVSVCLCVCACVCVCVSVCLWEREREREVVELKKAMDP